MASLLVSMKLFEQKVVMMVMMAIIMKLPVVKQTISLILLGSAEAVEIVMH